MVETNRKRAGVMGWPVKHSLSPTLHAYWLKENGLEGEYDLIEVSPEELEKEIKSLQRRGFAGVNITVPHKEKAAAMVDELENNARRIGAVNAITVRGDGTLLGRNTDGFGFLENLKACAPEWRANHGPAVVLGAGGAARAIVAALMDAGVPELRLINRTGERAQKLARDVDSSIQVLPWNERAKALGGANVLVNTTSLGMDSNPPLDLDLDALPQTALVNDIVYRPLETTLLAQARSRGNPVADGLGMLIHQARPCFTEWFGGKAEATDGLRAALLRKLEESGP